MAPLGTQPAIAIAGLSKDYGSGHGLFALELEIEQGEVFGFLGPNGAGKSTTMRLLLDLIKPTSGSALVLGLNTRENSLEIRRRVGFLPGDFALYPKLTGAKVLDYLADLRGGVDRRVRDALTERFDADLDRPIHELSTGNRQKLGLIQAFMHDPELLILDEPIAGLDPLVQQSFHRLLAETSSRGRTVFLSSHTLSEVERVTHRAGRPLVSQPAFRMTLRLRLPSTGLAALGLVTVLLVIGALFPAVGHSFGKLNIPKGVSHLLGGVLGILRLGHRRDSARRRRGHRPPGACHRSCSCRRGHRVADQRIRPARWCDRVAQIPVPVLLLRGSRSAHRRR